MEVIAALLLSGAVYRSDLPIEQVRRRLQAPKQEFVALYGLPWNRQEAMAEADKITANGAWGEASMASPIRWTGYPRSFSFHLNAWAPVNPYYSAVSQGADERYFDEGYRIAYDWVKTNIPPIQGVTTLEEMDSIIGQNEEFVWYDMGVGLRIYPLAWTLARIAGDPGRSDDEVKLFVDGLYFHMEALGRPRFYKKHNNHGFFQAIGQFAAARQVTGLPKMDEYAALALTRLEEIVERQFSASWVHLEHSPSYHMDLLRSFLALRTLGVPERPDLLKGIAEMEDALVWMFTPEYRLAAFGDTTAGSPNFSEKLVSLLQNEHLVFQVTDGRRGERPPDGVRTYPDAGYVFARFASASGDYPESSYLAQMAAFHSRTHKHADHSTFIWHDRGVPILVDAGRFGYAGRTERDSELWKKGYWYSDPNRMYVESTRAHNTVEVDGDDLPRVGVKPFGPFLKSGEQQGGLVVTESDAFYDKDQALRHRRLLIFRPGEFLLVIDRLNDKRPHTYTQRFTFEPRWEAVREGELIKATMEGRTVLVRSLLSGAEPIPVERGVTEPRMQGWHSHEDGKIVPASSIGFEEKHAAAGRFVTLFTFGQQLHADPAVQKVDEAMTELTLKWTVDGQERKVSISAPEGGPVKAIPGW